MKVLNVPSLRVTAFRSSPLWRIGQPIRSPMAAASAMIASVKRSSSGSSSSRSQVAPVSADIGFIVMLPQSLYHMSAWIRFETVVSKPAAGSRSASALTRFEAAPLGSPMISSRPKP
jgi:hypothetical protein